MIRLSKIIKTDLGMVWGCSKRFWKLQTSYFVMIKFWVPSGTSGYHLGYHEIHEIDSYFAKIRKFVWFQSKMASYHGTPWYPKVFFQKVWCLTSSKHFCNRSYHSSVNFCVYTANTTIWKLKKRIFWNIKKKSAEILLLIVVSWSGVFGEWWVPNGVFIAHLSNGTQNFLPSHFCLFSNQWRFLKPTTFFWCLKKYP